MQMVISRRNSGRLNTMKENGYQLSKRLIEEARYTDMHHLSLESCKDYIDFFGFDRMFQDDTTTQIGFAGELVRTTLTWLFDHGKIQFSEVK